MNIRIRVAKYCEQISPLIGEVEIDESYFGAKRVKGKKGRGSFGKTIVFGILERNKKVFTQIIPNCTSKTLKAALKGYVALESVIHPDKWPGYNEFVDVGYAKHFRVNHSQSELANHHSHISIVSFWSFAKRRLSKFNGVPKDYFYLHLKATEFRFNYRKEILHIFVLGEV